MTELESSWQEVKAQIAEVDRLYDARQFDEAIVLITSILPAVLADGARDTTIHLYRKRGLAHQHRSAGDRGSSLKAAADDLMRAVQLADDAETAADLLMQMGSVVSDDVRGDMGEHRERGLEFLRLALAQLDGLASPDLQAMVRTNLAVMLLRRESDNRLENLREAHEPV